MQWDEIDRHNAVWVVPSTRMKTGEAFPVPLSDRALDLLAEARRVARKPPGPDSFVFFGVIPKRPLSNMALAMLLRRMNVGVTVHGFRSSFKIWASEIGHVEFEIAESCLSHRVGNAVSARLQQIEPLGEAASGHVLLGELRRGQRRRQRRSDQRPRPRAAQAGVTMTLVVVVAVAFVAWLVWKRVALVSKPTLLFVRERLREAFARRSFDPVEFAPVLEAMAGELFEEGVSGADVLNWADLYANVAYQARFGLLHGGSPEAEIWKGVEARLPPTVEALRRGHDQGRH